jgi:hypothetical protein
MSRDLTAEFVNEIEKAAVTAFFAVELMFDVTQQNPSGPLRFWSGLGEQTIDGNIYVGSGNMLGISTIDETSEISAKGATLTLSGIPSELISLALSEPYQGRKCKIYFGILQADTEYLSQEDNSLILNEDGSGIILSQLDLAATMSEIFSGYIDQMNIDEGPETATISVGVESRLIDLQRPRVLRYTRESQRSRFPNDKGFDFVNDLQSKKFAWGR